MINTSEVDTAAWCTTPLFHWQTPLELLF